jgi:hypothetical protein
MKRDGFRIRATHADPSRLDHRAMMAVALSLESRRSARSGVRSGSRYRQDGLPCSNTAVRLMRDETLGEG